MYWILSALYTLSLHVAPFITNGADSLTGYLHNHGRGPGEQRVYLREYDHSVHPLLIPAPFPAAPSDGGGAGAEQAAEAEAEVDTDNNSASEADETTPAPSGTSSLAGRRRSPT